MAGEHPHSAVQTQTQVPVHLPHPHPPHPVRDRDHEHDVKGLRLALGSILSPKRIPSSRASASSSGTASPAHFGPGLVHPYPYPHSQSHGHGYAPHEPSHLHTPAPEPEEDDDRPHGALRTDSGLSAEGRRPVAAMLRQSSASSASSVQSHSSHLSQSHSQSHSQPETQSQTQLPTPPSEPAPPTILTTSNVHTLTPAQTQQVLKDIKKEDARSKMTDSEKEQRGYIATLQSRRAWDALVHGNMS